jgi:hypothetical protein
MTGIDLQARLADCRGDVFSGKDSTRLAKPFSTLGAVS